MTVETQDKLANARSSALASYASIKEMVEALNKAREAEDDSAIEEAERAIHEDALSVEVRTDWFSPSDVPAAAIAEYRILLSWGGPAVQVRGDLDEHGEPKTARLQMQDWFIPWTDVHWGDLGDTNAEDILLTFARCFYFGEG
jgi:hypothetical protein